MKVHRRGHGDDLHAVDQAQTDGSAVELVYLNHSLTTYWLACMQSIVNVNLPHASPPSLQQFGNFNLPGILLSYQDMGKRLRDHGILLELVVYTTWACTGGPGSARNMDTPPANQAPQRVQSDASRTQLKA